MPKAIPGGLTSDHVLLALQDLDNHIEHTYGPPRGYELVHKGKRYAPKAVVGIAFRHLTGSMLDHDEFSGGEAVGQANFVLRKLGFNVERIQNQGAAFITSNGHELPNDANRFAIRPWFNMWKRRLWPYNELKVGDTLFWYDSKLKMVVWKTKVTKTAPFQYANKNEARELLLKEYGDDPADDPYFIKASDHGYCLAFKVKPLERLNLPKPDDYKFPKGGWLRCSAPKAQEWLSEVLDNSYGINASELNKTLSKVEEEGYFDPATLEDERERKLREIVQRRGQPTFRNKLIATYGGCCAVTGCDATPALEAAHITPYNGSESNHVSNGLLLRADIHTLFDLNLIGIQPDTKQLVLAEHLKNTCYAELCGRQVVSPDDLTKAPSQEALETRWKEWEAHNEST